MSINKSTESLEQPLSTPTKDQQEVEKEKSTVTIFDVATEIETMLNEIYNEIEENSKEVDSFVDKINTRLDKIETKIRSSQ